MSASSSGDLVATGIQRADLGHVWASLWPLLEPAYKTSDEQPDILAGIYAKELHLWAVFEKMVPLAGIVSKLLRSGEGTSSELHCHLWLVGGSRLSDWSASFLDILIPWAKAEGCCAVTGNGRRGWTRIVGKHGGYRIEDRDGRPCWRLDI